MAINESIIISVRQDGALQVQRDLSNIGVAADRSRQQVNALTRALGLIASTLGARQLITMSDAFQNLENRIKATLLPGENAANVFQDLLDVANRSRSDLEATGKMYTRLALQADRLGLTHDDLIRVVDILNKTLVVSGATTVEAKNSMLQFSQALGAGRLNGDELRSVLENNAVLAKALQTEFGAAGKELVQMGADGLLSMDRVLKVVNNLGAEMDRLFGIMPMTIGQSFTVLRNNTIAFIGEANQATGAAQLLSQTILFLANNVNILVPAVVALGAAFLAVQAYQIVAGFVQMIVTIGQLTVSIAGLTAVMLANPLFLGAAAVIGAVATLITLFDGWGPVMDAAALAAQTLAGAVEWLLDALGLLPAAASAAEGAVSGLNKAAGGSATNFRSASQAASELAKNVEKITPGARTAQQALNNLKVKSQDTSNNMKNDFKGVGDNIGREVQRGVQTAMSALNQLQSAMSSFASSATAAASQVVAAMNQITAAAQRAAAAASSASSGGGGGGGGGGGSSGSGGGRGGGGGGSSIGLGQITGPIRVDFDPYEPGTSWNNYMGWRRQNPEGYRQVLISYLNDELGKLGLSWSNELLWAATAYRQVLGRFLGGDNSIINAVTDSSRSYAQGVAQVIKNAQKKGHLPGFANGGSFMVGGVGGTDSQLVQFMASPNERVTIETPRQQREREREGGGRGDTNIQIQMTVVTKDAESFRRSQSQLATELQSRLMAVQYRMGV